MLISAKLTPNSYLGITLLGLQKMPVTGCLWLAEAQEIEQVD